MKNNLYKSLQIFTLLVCIFSFKISSAQGVNKNGFYFKIADSSSVVLPTYDANFVGTYPYLQWMIDSLNVTKIERQFPGLNSQLSKTYTVSFSNPDSTKIDWILDEILIRNGNMISFAQPCHIYNVQANIPNDTLLSSQWYLEKINAFDAWDLSEGEDIVIAIIDKGFNIDHPDIAPNVYKNLAEINGVAGVDDDGNGFVDDTSGWNAPGNNNNVYPSRPWDTHGDLVSSIAIAKSNNITGTSGIAPKAKLLPIKYESANSHGAILQDANKALYYAVVNNPDIINMSYGNPIWIDFGLDTVEQMLIKYADSIGIIIVASAGNENNARPDGVGPTPAIYPEVISVAALDSNLGRSVISNFGSYSNVRIAAPGEFITAPIGPNGTYVTQEKGGTSSAAPMVAGAIALIKSRHPTFTKSQIQGCLLNSTNDLYPYDKQYYNQLGTGYLNLQKAVSCQTNYEFSIIKLGRLRHCIDDTLQIRPSRIRDSSLTFLWYLNDQYIGKTQSSQIFKTTTLAGTENISLQAFAYLADSLVFTSETLIIQSIACSSDQVSGSSKWIFDNDVSLIWGAGGISSSSVGTSPVLSPSSLDHNGENIATGIKYTNDSFGVNRYRFNTQNYKIVDPNPYNVSIQSYPIRQDLLTLSHPTEANKIIHIVPTRTQNYIPKNGLTFIVEDLSGSGAGTQYIQRSGPVFAQRHTDGSILTSGGITSLRIDNQDYICVRGYENDVDPLVPNMIYIYRVSSGVPDSLLLFYEGNYELGFSSKNAQIGRSPNDKYIFIVNDQSMIYSEKTKILNVNSLTDPLLLTTKTELLSGYKFGAFSPDSKLFYTFSLDDNGSIFQFDITHINPASTKTPVAKNLGNILDMKLGPDGTIYIKNEGLNRDIISTIDFPNKKELGNNECGFSIASIHTKPQLAGGRFPNSSDIRFLECNDSVGFNFSNCSDIELYLVNPTCICDTVTWNFNGQTIVAHKSFHPRFNLSDIKPISGSYSCNGQVNFFEINAAVKIKSSSNKIIPGQNVSLTLGDPIIGTYNWFRNGMSISTKDTLVTNLPGEYWLEFSSCNNNRYKTNKLILTIDESTTNTTYYNPSIFVFSQGIHNLNASSGYRLGEKIIIENGASVKIDNTTLLMDSNAEIIVQPGGNLEILGSTLSSNTNWRGIKILGEHLIDIDRNIPSSMHGTVEMSESDITNADTALNSMNGGLVLCVHSTLSNNLQHASLRDYNFEHNSTFLGCNFGNHRLPVFSHSTALKVDSFSHVNISNVKDVHFYENKHLEYQYSFDKPRENIVGYSVVVQAAASKIDISGTQVAKSFISFPIKLTNTDSVKITGSVIGETYGMLGENGHIETGILLENASNTVLLGNDIKNSTNGVLVLSNNIEDQDTIKMYENVLQNNTYGLAIGETMHPVNNDTNANQSTEPIHVFFRCNDFISNEIGIVLDSSVISQLDGNQSFDNTFINNTNWDLVSEQGSSVKDIGTVNINHPMYNREPMLLKNAIQINGRSAADEYDEFGNRGLAACSNYNIAMVASDHNAGTHASTHTPKGYLNDYLEAHKAMGEQEEQQSVNAYTIYPNPTTSSIEIVMPTRDIETQIDLLTVHGEILMQRTVSGNRLTIDMQALPSGVYLVRIHAADENKVYRVIKK